MKDDAMSAEVNGLNDLPIPEIRPAAREALENAATELFESTSLAACRVYDLETAINSVVVDLFEVTEEELSVLESSEPPRDPVTVALKKCAKVEV